MSMKINIVSIAGGLGNQMFQYAYYLSLISNSDHNNINIFYIAPYRRHNGYELDKVFNIKKSPISNMSVRIVKKLFAMLVEKNCNINFGSYEGFKRNFYRPIIYHTGYWQSELYFKNIESVIRKQFIFNEKIFLPKNLEIIKKMNTQQSVSIHVRMGDYESDPGAKSVHGGICTIEYYKKAIQTIQKKVSGNLYFYIFTDDIEWVKSNLFLDNAIIVDWNRKKDSWQDMMLMSYCKNNIIANSSFSWWGAWLNSYENKIVIAPSKWFNTMSAPDILPKTWIKL